MSEKQLGVLLVCFSEASGAGRARRAVDRRLASGGDAALDTVVLKVSSRHKASVHDPRRVLLGTLTPALTWGLFGLIASGWLGLVIWAAAGALCGGPYTYYAVHHASKAELNHIGNQLPVKSSALLIFAETTDASRMLAAAQHEAPSVASVAAIDDDLSAHVLGGTAAEDGKRVLSSMIMTRYPGPDGAAKAASRIAADKKLADAAEVDTVIKTEPDGHRHVADRSFGVAATVKNDIISWGGFGVVAGAIAGASGGGILEGGLVTGIAWALFGVFAGALYGLWAGRSISARRLKGIGPILAPGTSTVLAWADGSVRQDALAALDGSDSRRLVLHFSATGGGAVLEPT